MVIPFAPLKETDELQIPNPDRVKKENNRNYMMLNEMTSTGNVSVTSNN